MESLVYIGLMSGTSGDGLDVCAATFNGNGFHMLCAETYNYSPQQQQTLLNAHKLSTLELAQLDVDFGKFCGQRVKEFTEKHQIHADYVASHGQTVFHTPNTGHTLPHKVALPPYAISVRWMLRTAGKALRSFPLATNFYFPNTPTA